MTVRGEKAVGGRKIAPIILLPRFYEAFKTLTDAKAGALIKTIYAYRLENKEPTFKGDPLTTYIWNDVKMWLDESQKSYEEKCEKNKKAIEARWNKDTNV